MQGAKRTINTRDGKERTLQTVELVDEAVRAAVGRGRVSAGDGV